MRIDIISVLPELMTSAFEHSIVSRALKKGIVQIFTHNLRDYATGVRKNIDDYPFGGKAGMVLMIEPIDKCITELKSQRSYDEVIYLSPDGQTLNQNMANQLSLSKNLMLLCGHYKGIDQRIRDHFITREISIGDYVLSGGELAATVLTDAIVRLIPGAIGDETSALTDSFQDSMLDAPVYTRPENYKGWEVPRVLLSGNHAKIEDWNYEQALKKTQLLRPDLLDKKP